MKKQFGILVVALVLQVAVFAQPNKAQVEQKVESMRVAHITNALELSVEQAQTFWPIYNAYTDERKAMRKSNRPNKRPNEMTEAEAEQFILAHFQNEERRLDMERSYLQKMRTVLSAQQIVKLQFAEKQFKRQLVKRVQEKKRQH